MSRFSGAIGIWELDMCDPPLELKPTMADIKAFRNILVNEESRKHRAVLFDKFAEFMWGLINIQYPTECQVKNENGDNEVRFWVELHLNLILEEAMIAFKWANRDDLAKVKKESVQELKKVMSNA